MIILQNCEASIQVLIMSNNTTEIYFPDWLSPDDHRYRVITNATLGLVILIVNILTLIAILLYEKTRENYMILISSLNFSDALVGLSLVLDPVSILVDYTECGFDVLAQTVLISYFGTLVSQCHTVALSIDRCIAVQYALNYHSIMSPFRLKLLVATSWIIASVETLIFSLMNYFGLCFWNYKGLSDVTNLLPFLHIVVVFTINAAIYGKLWSVARRQRRQIAQFQQQQNNTIGVNKATVMVMVIVALYGLLWSLM